ncbi:hypothetical protein BUALT_Bualt02G0202100 [Buddleja alternifolia]|uniref:Uncharacterized protein n=1 Tax=Buddleja alternifolia TaxID=168488 RepID=A0AAV6Y8W7_9LAMI|nr:hypothetical protein BUALT_Bualt02G0202100 [Buddleja alternifolia]
MDVAFSSKLYQLCSTFFVVVKPSCRVNHLSCFAESSKSIQKPDTHPGNDSDSKPTKKTRCTKLKRLISDDEEIDENDESSEKKKKILEEDLDWPLHADVDWGIRASEYFDQHPIQNVLREDGTEIDDG